MSVGAAVEAHCVEARHVVALCAGKECRKRCEFAKLRAAFERERDVDVVQLKCVGLCSGPVAVTGVTSDAPVVYSKLRTKRHRRLVVAAASGNSTAVAALAERKVAKKKVIASVARQIERRSA